MSWTPLREDYTDAVWEGLKKYVPVQNSDETVSFRDVTQYSNRENSFFGAMDANRINEAVNIIMAMLEDGTDLYTAFLAYFETQKTLFQNAANEDLEIFQLYLDNLQATANSDVAAMKRKYTTEMDTFEAQQQALFTQWFDMIKGQLTEDVAGHLQNEIDKILVHIHNLAVKIGFTNTSEASTNVKLTNTTTGTIYTVTNLAQTLYLTEAGHYTLECTNESVFIAPSSMNITKDDLMSSKTFRIFDGNGLAFVGGFVGSYVNNSDTE